MANGSVPIAAALTSALRKLPDTCSNSACLCLDSGPIVATTVTADTSATSPPFLQSVWLEAIAHMSEPTNQSDGSERRRSARVLIEIGVIAQGANAEGRAFGEKTKTVAVNAHGALIRLAQDIRAGELITLTHCLTEEQQTCRVVYAGPNEGIGRPVGVEFLKPAPQFWRIAFPPRDWIPLEEEISASQPRFS